MDDVVDVAVVFIGTVVVGCVDEAIVAEVKSVDGWCNVVIGGGFDDTTMFGASVFIIVGTADNDDVGTIAVGDVFIVTEESVVVPLEGVVLLVDV